MYNLSSFRKARNIPVIPESTKHPVIPESTKGLSGIYSVPIQYHISSYPDNRFRLFGRNDEFKRFRLFGRNDGGWRKLEGARPVLSRVEKCTQVESVLRGFVSIGLTHRTGIACLAALLVTAGIGCCF